MFLKIVLCEMFSMLRISNKKNPKNGVACSYKKYRSKNMLLCCKSYFKLSQNGSIPPLESVKGSSIYDVTVLGGEWVKNCVTTVLRP